MKVLVVLGSPRRNGNSAILAEKFSDGAKEKGLEVDTVFLQDKEIKACTACEGCHRENSKGCVIKDDMQELYTKMEETDVVLLASPIYWFNISAQLKLFIDRCYALFDASTYKTNFPKKAVLIFTYGDPDALGSGCINALRSFQDAFKFIGTEIVETIHGSAMEAGDIKKNQVLMDKAYEAGKNLAADS